jgi:WD40 repeat protein
MPKTLNSQWYKGPVTDRLIDAHPRPIQSISIRGDELVTASDDHGLKVWSIASGELKRELYTKQYGHQEQVTTVDHVKYDGRIVSGGMDSKLCLWNANSTKCVDLMGHTSSISLVKCAENRNIALSSSYDKTMKVWNLDNQQCLHTMTSKNGHKKAIRTFFWKNSLVCSGGSEGLVCIWDVNTGALVSVLEEHEAPILSINALTNQDTNVLLTGCMKGKVGVWDLRTCNIVQSVDAMNGSVNDIKVSNPEETPDDPFPSVVLAGSNKLIRTLDPRKSFQVRQNIKGHAGAIYTLAVKDNLIFSGAENGWVLVHDFISGKCLYGVVVCENQPCQCVELAPDDHLVAAGADGKVVIFDYQ